jgi:hypothetical protein
MAGFCELATSLWAPILGILRGKTAIVSRIYAENSRFLEIAAGDMVRSALRAEGAVQLAKFSAAAAGKSGTPSPHCLAGRETNALYDPRHYPIHSDDDRCQKQPNAPPLFH